MNGPEMSSRPSAFRNLIGKVMGRPDPVRHVPK